ncbi:MAG: hypothetical protein JNK29_10610 [Anaerolineales bacterium]|nr:hypothetical protein [Anaerolineales bacterium]
MTKARSPQRKNTSIIATLVTLVVVALVWLGQQFLAAPAVETPAPGPGSWYELYFTDPDTTANLKDPAGGVPAAVTASFAAAQRSLDVAVYEIDLPVYADALIQAQARGVRVRVVTDTDYRDERAAQALRTAGIPIVDDQRDPFMHNKFVVIDGSAVWTGSMNFTFNDAYRNNNNAILIRSTRLAENYTAQFEHMFTDRVFNQAAAVLNPAVNLSGTLVETSFSPAGNTAAKVVDVLNSAQTSVQFMAFAFTRADFTDVLLAKAQAGVSVRGVFERRQVEAGADSAWQALQAGGLDVRLDGNPYVLHHKVFIIDGQIVVLGSYNFSRNAEDYNDENLLIIHNAEIAAAFAQEWQKVWGRAEK